LVRRKDDTFEALITRLEAYHKQTSPLVDYYDKQGIHWSVDASKSEQQVYNSISNLLKESKQKKFKTKN